MCRGSEPSGPAYLRHPLLALDVVRALTRGRALIETAVCDRSLGEAAGESLVRFHRLDDLNGDGSNWFEPGVAALAGLCRSSGLEPIGVSSWPAEAPGRCMMTAAPAWVSRSIWVCPTSYRSVARSPRDTICPAKTPRGGAPGRSLRGERLASYAGLATTRARARVAPGLVIWLFGVVPVARGVGAGRPLFPGASCSRPARAGASSSAPRAPAGVC